MTTDAQRQANARNALASTGPRTAEGLEKTSQNALVHGLHASTAGAIVNGSLAEDPVAIAAFVESVVSPLRPETVFEREAAMRIAVLLLRMRRVSRLEVFGLGESDDLEALLKLEEVISRVEGRTARELQEALTSYRDARSRREESIGHQVCLGLSELLEADQRDAKAAGVDREPSPVDESGLAEQRPFLSLPELLELQLKDE